MNFGRSAALSLRLPWPLPALAAWALAWVCFRALTGLAAPAWLGLLAGSAVGLGLGLGAGSRLRAGVMVAGFPLSLLASGMGAALPAWAWLLPLALLWLLYPRRAWRDAPLFPTPAGALDALAETLPLPPDARVLDAGCGLGHGLRALRRAIRRRGSKASSGAGRWRWLRAWPARGRA